MSDDNSGQKKPEDFKPARVEAGLIDEAENPVTPSVPLEEEPVEDPTKPDNPGWEPAREGGGDEIK